MVLVVYPEMSIPSWLFVSGLSMVSLIADKEVLNRVRIIYLIGEGMYYVIRRE